MKLSLIALMAGFSLVVGLPMAATAGPSSSADGADADGIGQAFDNCLNQNNPRQGDYDHDGCGQFCDFDWNNNGIVSVGEVALAAGQFGSPCQGPACQCDFNENGVCAVGEVASIAASFSKKPGPSGITNAVCIPARCTCTPAP